ncbi:MAG: hypothetical protein WCG23_00895 [bacterium]
MMNNLVLNTPTFRTNIRSINNTPKQPLKVGFKGSEDEAEKDKLDLSTSKKVKEESDNEVKEEKSSKKASEEESDDEVKSEKPSKKVKEESDNEVKKEKSSKKHVKKDNINWQEAAKNFGKGAISPATTLISSPTNMAVGAGAIAGITFLNAKCKNAKGHSPVGILLVAFGLATGAYQAYKGIRKFNKAKDHIEKEKSFYDIGAGTCIGGISVYSANSALTSAGINTGKNLNIIEATWQSIKNIPNAFQEILSNVTKPGFVRGAAAAAGIGGAAPEITDTVASTEGDSVAEDVARIVQDVEARMTELTAEHAPNIAAARKGIAKAIVTDALEQGTSITEATKAAIDGAMTPLNPEVLQKIAKINETINRKKEADAAISSMVAVLKPSISQGDSSDGLSNEPAAQNYDSNEY